MTISERVDHPQHYAVVPGVECIDVVEHFSFVRGNAIKYLWRAGAKGDLVEDLQKAIWYIEREIAAQEPPIEGGVSEGASRLGVRGGTQRHESTAGDDSLKVVPEAPETLPAAEEGTSGRAARPASTSCGQCGQRTPVCADCDDSIIFVPKSGFGNQGEWRHLAPPLTNVGPHMARPKVFVS